MHRLYDQLEYSLGILYCSTSVPLTPSQLPSLYLPSLHKFSLRKFGGNDQRVEDLNSEWMKQCKRIQRVLVFLLGRVARRIDTCIWLKMGWRRVVTLASHWHLKSLQAGTGGKFCYPLPSRTFDMLSLAQGRRVDGCRNLAKFGALCPWQRAERSPSQVLTTHPRPHFF